MCSETLQSPSYDIHKTAIEYVRNILIVHMSLVKRHLLSQGTAER